MVTPTVTFQGAPAEKGNKLFVKKPKTNPKPPPNRPQISVVGFESLPGVLAKTSEAAEHFQALYYTQNTSGK